MAATSPLVYPRRVELALTPTPLQPLHRASEVFGGGRRLWIKRDDLTGSVLSGNKVRKLEFIAALAQDSGCDTLITCGGLQSNHCRATALVGAQLGLKVHLVLRGVSPAVADGNLLLDELAGAHISCYPKSEYVARLPELLEEWSDHCARSGGKALILPTGASDGHGIWGYIAAAEELKADFEQAGIDRAHIVCATGSGGTQAGLTLGAQLHELPATVWGINVCDDEAWFLNKVAADVAAWANAYEREAPPLQPRVIDGYVGPGYGVATPEVHRAIAELAALEGIVLDPVYTGKAWYGLCQELAAGRFDDVDDIVFVHTGGVFGLFPQRDALHTAALQ